jgi:DUF917 family protein
MFIFDKNNLLALSTGATMLGSGGGGNPNILYDLIRYQLDIYGEAKVIDIKELEEQHLIVPLAFVGAPLVSTEKIPNIKIFDIIFQRIQEFFPERHIVLMPAEIGGCNALTPFLIASKYNVPVLDGDLIGRAFPELNICKPFILKQSCDPTIIADTQGNAVTLHLMEQEKLETIVRSVVVNFGSSAGIATFICHGKAIDNHVISGSISHALALGKTWLDNKARPEDFFKKTGSTLIATGMIKDIFYDLKNGFLTGYATLDSAQGEITVYYQNEFLLVKQGKKVLVGSPDIITLIDAKTGLLITTETLHYGISVHVIRLPSPPFWQTATALERVDYKKLNLENKNEACK